jgi:transposase
MKPFIPDNAEFAGDLAKVIYVSVELSQSTWLVTSFSPAVDTKIARKGLPAGEIGRLLSLLADIRSKAHRQTGEQLPIIMIQEADLDGFWVHRVLVEEGLESYVMDPTSIAVPRKAR